MTTIQSSQVGSLVNRCSHDTQFFIHVTVVYCAGDNKQASDDSFNCIKTRSLQNFAFFDMVFTIFDPATDHMQVWGRYACHLASIVHNITQLQPLSPIDMKPFECYELAVHQVYNQSSVTRTMFVNVRTVESGKIRKWSMFYYCAINWNLIWYHN